MKKGILLLIIFMVTSSMFANGLSLNSIGPKALGMGGAFVGLADDGSAIYWNPAGLIGQENAINISVADIIPIGSYSAESDDYGFPAGVFSIDADLEKNNYVSPDIFANYNMGKMAFGLGIYVPAGLGAEYDGADLVALTGDPDFEWMSKIGAISFSPTFAYKVMDNWSLGLAANIYYGMFDLKRAAIVPDVGSFQYSEESTGLGYGVTLGSMYNFSDKLSLGVTYRSPVAVAMEGTAKNAAFAAYGVPESDFERDVTWPTWIAGGIAYKALEKLTLTFDVQWSDWKALDKLVTKFDDPVWVGATVPTGENEFILYWDSQTQVRLGMEYQLKPCLALRGGLYYDPAPAPDKALTILFPSQTYTVITGGIGYNKGKISVDFGTEYLLGEERDVEDATHNMPGKHNMDIFAFALGLGFKF